MTSETEEPETESILRQQPARDESEKICLSDQLKQDGKVNYEHEEY